MLFISNIQNIHANWFRRFQLRVEKKSHVPNYAFVQVSYINSICRRKRKDLP